jgi:aminomethyltransferase
MKRTAFYSVHQRLGAKIVPFAGYEMPVMYTSILDEHRTVRNAVGVFDVSHMGEFEIAGPDALALVQSVTTNDASKLTPGKVQYSAMCYPDGGIVDDLLVYRIADDKFMLVVNAANLTKDFEWIRSNIGGLSATCTDLSDATSLLAIQGPASLKTLRKLTAVNLEEIPYYAFRKGTLAGVEMLISRTGYTGELGYEIYFESSVPTGELIWKTVMEAGAEFGIKPIGLGARDTLRLEMGFCLYGNDIDQTTNPLEAGLGWITKMEKGAFLGQNVLREVKQQGLKRKLVGFTVDDPKAFPRHGYEIKSKENILGHVTSGTVSPVLEKGIGMGYVNTAAAAPGTMVEIVIRDRHVPARIVPLPFITK